MKSLRFQVTIYSDMINIETPTSTEAGDFYYSAIFSRQGITSGMQANHDNTEWPDLRDKLEDVALAVIEAYIEWRP